MAARTRVSSTNCTRYPITVRIGGVEHAWTVDEARSVRNRIDVVLKAHEAVTGVRCWACSIGHPVFMIEGVPHHDAGPVYDICGNAEVP